METDLETLATAVQQIPKWLEKRDKLIRRLHEQGVSVNRLAAHSGMSRAGIAKILRKG